MTGPSHPGPRGRVRLIAGSLGAAAVAGLPPAARAQAGRDPGPEIGGALGPAVLQRARG